MTSRLPLSALLATAALALVAAATLLPSWVVGPLRSDAFTLLDALGATADWGDLEQLANAALFVPVGAAVALAAGRRWWLVAVPIGAALSLAIETAQASVPGRVPDLADIAWNTLGAAVGGAVAALVLGAAAAVRRRGASPAPASRRPAAR